MDVVNLVDEDEKHPNNCCVVTDNLMDMVSRKRQNTSIYVVFRGYAMCLLPVLYKAFTKCVLNRIWATLEEAQPFEQAGFRRSFSTIDHIHSIHRLLENSQTQKVFAKESHLSEPLLSLPGERLQPADMAKSQRTR
uniref:Reverse transcriptase domain-containing protein n=1 Tax=Caenorhabditis japonica TaxID=281687 RepID=A0A8R1EFL0_CAEJA